MYGRIKKMCDKCLREITVNNYNRHYKVCDGPIVKKIRGIDFDPNHGFKTGERSAWNKGLKSKPDNRNPLYIGQIGGYRENAGRSKKFRVNDSFGKSVVLQSSYELLCSQILNNLNIKWIRPKALFYDNKRYFADFYLIDFDIYLDPKNKYKAKQDEEKIKKVILQNNIKVKILFLEELTVDNISKIVREARASTDN